MNPSGLLDVHTKTFESDRSYFDKLAFSPLGDLVFPLFVYQAWKRTSLAKFSKSLVGTCESRFGSKNIQRVQSWTGSLVYQISNDAGVIPYLTLRGLPFEAASAARRLLESAGLLGRFWSNPELVQYLELGEYGPDEYENQKEFAKHLFQWNGPARKIDGIKISGRFAAFHVPDPAPGLATEVYRGISKYCVHASLPQILINLERDEQKCGFVTRSVATNQDVENIIKLFTEAVRLSLAEIIFVTGEYANQSDELSDAGSEFMRLLPDIGVQNV